MKYTSKVALLATEGSCHARHSLALMSSSIIWLRTDAPAKPAVGERCNGCGVCCASAPCPIGMLASGSLAGRCRALVWHPHDRQYRCGLLAATAGSRWRSWLVRRWIAAGAGCDSQAEVSSH